MTLIFLASVVLLEYILGRPHADGRTNTQPAVRQESEPIAVADSASLHRLGHVLGHHGKGRNPASEPQPADRPTIQG